LGVRTLSRQGQDNPGLVPVYLNGRVVGCWTGPLPDWGWKAAYRMRRDTLGTVEMRTLFDDKWNAVGLEIADAADLAGWPEFRLTR
jgi:hypothetical protein